MNGVVPLQIVLSVAFEADERKFIHHDNNKLGCADGKSNGESWESVKKNYHESPAHLGRHAPFIASNEPTFQTVQISEQWL
jgi:hypothetical protein